MSPQPSADLTVTEAQTLLDRFTCADLTAEPAPEEPAIVRQALILVARESEYQMLGVCADSREAALKALRDYLPALGYATPVDPAAVPDIEGPVYVKFNGRSETYHASPYQEKYRGVLVSCQSTEVDGVNGTYGHFPLDLFA
ncbi:MAG: DUF1824 family protein [Limnospira sp.]